MRANTASFEGQSPDLDRALALAREAMEAWLAQNPGRQIPRATAALRAGLDPKTVAKLGGWKDVATVMRFYAHAREDATLSDAVFGNSPVGAQLVKVK